MACPPKLRKLLVDGTSWVIAWMAELADLPAGRQARTNNMFYVYVLSSTIQKYIYVGLTNDLKRRIGQHNNGKERTTRAYKPYTCIHTEEFETRTQARIREKYLKSGIGKEWIKENCF